MDFQNPVIDFERNNTYIQSEGVYGYNVIGTVCAFTELMDSTTTVEGSEICMENRPDVQMVVLSPANVGRS